MGDKPETTQPDWNGLWNGLQALAWIMWRTPEAVECFSHEDAEDKWEMCLLGRFPNHLGKPKVSPAMAERELLEAMNTKRVKYKWGAS